MKENLSPDLSKKNPYYIPRERFYELRHFCLQYNEWGEELIAMDSMPARKFGQKVQSKGTDKMDPVHDTVARREKLTAKMELVNQAALKTDTFFAPYIVAAVSQYTQYDTFRIESRIPCCREQYYKLLRKFYWILDKMKD